MGHAPKASRDALAHQQRPAVAGCSGLDEHIQRSLLGQRVREDLQVRAEGRKGHRFPPTCRNARQARFAAAQVVASSSVRAAVFLSVMKFDMATKVSFDRVEY